MPNYDRKLTSYLLTASLLLSVFAQPTGAQTAAENDRLLAEKMAYHIGVMAYLYGYPLVDMHKQMHNDTHRVSKDQSTCAPVNRFYHFKSLVTPGTAGTLRAPNSDTLYFAGWFDLRKEPVIIHNPDTRGRYFTMAVTNQFAEVTHLGRRTIGTKEQYHALVGPGWQGELPEGVTAVQVDTPVAWILGRLLVDGKADEAQALAMLEQFWASPLSTWKRGQPLPPFQEVPGKPMDPLGTLVFFELMNRALKEIPRRPDETALLSQFDAIGIGPDSDFIPEQLDEATRRGLERAIEDGRKMVRASTARTIPMVNRWMISREIGRYGDNYMQRAATVAGGYGNLPEESLYAATLFDQNHAMLKGEKSYRLHFTAAQLPPVNGFWSLAAYRVQDSNLERNILERYSLGDRTKGLQYGDDGSLTVFIQHELPEAGESNWLPAPESGFYIILRLYEPRDALLDGRYEVPALELVN